MIFVTLHNGMRYALIGDLEWQLEKQSRNAKSDPGSSGNWPTRLLKAHAKTSYGMVAFKERLPI
jgi:hypothetical protein